MSSFQSTVYGDFAADYESSRLVDICEPKEGVQTGPFGSQLHQEDYVPVGTPIITVEHLGENRILHSDIPRVSEEDRERLSKYTLLKGDIVFSRVGSVDRRAIVRDEEEGWLFSGRCLRVRPNQNTIDSGYLSYFFGLPSFKEYIRAIAVGATMPSLNTKILSDLVIYFPNMPAQRAIAQILRTLDDKIELNRRMNETLEAMGQTLFKSWFVDFDPVHAKERGETPEYCCKHLNLMPEIYELFPNCFEESNLGEIPKGWKYQLADEIADIGIGKTPPRKESEWFTNDPNGIKWVSIRDMGEAGTFIMNTTENLTNEAVSRFNIRIVPSDTVLLSFKLTVGRVTITGQEMLTNEAIAHFKLPSKSNISKEFLYFYLKNFNYSELGSTSSIAEAINSKKVKEIPILVPSLDIMEAFSRTESKIFKIIQHKQRESVILASIRDTLLPKLISGELCAETSLLNGVR